MVSNDRRQTAAAQETAAAITALVLQHQRHHLDTTFAITVDTLLIAVREAVKLRQGRRGKIVPALASMRGTMCPSTAPWRRRKALWKS